MVVVCLGIFSVFPNIKRRNRCKEIFDRPYAHRGYYCGCTIPENSIAAFLRAKEKGYGIELDVQRTKDNRIVVFHDFELNRVVKDEAGNFVQGSVGEYTLAELKKFYLFDTQERICTLQECLDQISGVVPIIVEYKTNCKDQLLCELCHQILSRYQGVYCIESFNPYPMYWYRKHAPDVLRGQLSEPHLQENPDLRPRILYLALTYLLFNWMSRPDFIAYHCRYRKNFAIWFLHRVLKTPCIAWTIQSEAEKKRLEKEFDGYIFEGFEPD